MLVRGCRIGSVTTESNVLKYARRLQLHHLLFDVLIILTLLTVPSLSQFSLMVSTATATATATTTTTATTASNAGTLRDMAQYETQNLATIIKDALTDASDEEVAMIVHAFEQMDIECLEDLTFLAYVFKAPDALCEWLNNHTSAPGSACSRIANFLFS